MDASSSRADREVPAAFVLRKAYGGPSRQHWLPLPLQLLRSPCRLRTREKFETPGANRSDSAASRDHYGADSVQFYDMNFFLREDHARDLAERLAPLGLRWWCEARVDVMSRYSDATLAALRRGGCTMIFFGAESGSDWALKEMKKGITTEQTLQVAGRMKNFGIIPEFSFVVGNPGDPERDTRETLQFIRQIKRLDPRVRDHHLPLHACPTAWSMYGEIDGQIEFPATPEEWASKRWMDFTLRIDPNTPWLKRKTKNLIDNFESVVSSRWPTVQDIRAPRWSRALLQEPERLALFVASLWLSQRTALGAAPHRFAQAKAGEPVSATMTSVAKIPMSSDAPQSAGSSRSGPRSMTSRRIRCSRWKSASCRAFLPDVRWKGCCWMLDAARADGWHVLAGSMPRQLTGIDSSPEMLGRARRKLGPPRRLGGRRDIVAHRECFRRRGAGLVCRQLCRRSAAVCCRTSPHRSRMAASFFVSDIHPETAGTCNWKRGFQSRSGMQFDTTAQRSSARGHLAALKRRGLRRSAVGAAFRTCRAGDLPHCAASWNPSMPQQDCRRFTSCNFDPSKRASHATFRVADGVNLSLAGARVALDADGCARRRYQYHEWPGRSIISSPR